MGREGRGGKGREGEESGTNGLHGRVRVAREGKSEDARE